MVSELLATAATARAEGLARSHGRPVNVEEFFEYDDDDDDDADDEP
jgi:hypothetical protein